MYLNLIQIAESFGVSESVVEDWIRTEGLPHTPDRGRLLFDREQVANWAATRGLAARAGFLAPETAAFTTGWKLAPLLRAGGIWRDVAAAAAIETFARVVAVLPGATPPIRQLLGQRLRARGGVRCAMFEHLIEPQAALKPALGLRTDFGVHRDHGGRERRRVLIFCAAARAAYLIALGLTGTPSCWVSAPAGMSHCWVHFGGR